MVNLCIVTEWPPTSLVTVVPASWTGGAVFKGAPLFACWVLERDPFLRPPPPRLLTPVDPIRVESRGAPERTLRDDDTTPWLPVPDITLSFQDDAADIVAVVKEVVVDVDTGVGREANAQVIPLEVPVRL